MNERPNEPRPRESFEVGAWLRESSRDALDGPDREVMADEGIQRDPPRDDVPSRLLPRKIDRVEFDRFHCTVFGLMKKGVGDLSIGAAARDALLLARACGRVFPREVPELSVGRLGQPCCSAC